jgi:hypothetical protein
MIDNEIAIILQSFFSHKYIEIVTSKIDWTSQKIIWSKIKYKNLIFLKNIFKIQKQIGSKTISKIKISKNPIVIGHLPIIDWTSKMMNLVWMHKKSLKREKTMLSYCYRRRKFPSFPYMASI